MGDRRMFSPCSCLLDARGSETRAYAELGCSRRIRNIGARISSNGDYPTEMADVLWSFREGVGVLHPSPQINEFFTVLHIRDVFWSYRGCAFTAGGHATKDVSFRSDKGLYDSALLDREMIPKWEGAVSHLTLNVHGRILCRSLTLISPARPKAPIIQAGSRILLVVLHKGVCIYEGSLVSNQSLPSQLSLSPSHEQQPYTDQYVRYCEEEQGPFRRIWRVPPMLEGLSAGLPQLFA